MDGSKIAGARLAAADVASTSAWRRPIDWFVANEAWWRAIKAGDWDAYYERQYGARLAGSTAAAADPADGHAGAGSVGPAGVAGPRAEAD